MTNRNPVSVPYNLWNDAQRVDRDDMITEQDRNVQIDAAIVNNHFGSGVIPDSIEQKILFDSDNLTQEQSALVVSNDFDGSGIDVHDHPTDTNLGEQLEVQLTGAEVSGRFSVKVLVIGLDFQGVPQYDRFEFYKNEIQVTKKHYSRILTVFFNDFKGNNNCSRDRGGTVVIREVQSYQLSRDAIMASQDVEPNLFFRDFKISGLIQGTNATVSLYLTLQDGMGPEYSVDSLNIQTTVKQNRIISAGDVTTKIGHKFKAKTNNIQKISMLLGVQKDFTADVDGQFDWTGDLVISLYALQTSVSCPSSYVPELAIDFDPESQPLAQLSLGHEDFRNQGYVLTDILQPIDFVFSNTQLGSTANTQILPGKHYAITISRAGSANTGEIFTGVGNSVQDDSRLTIYSGSWVDVPEEELWFRVFTDAAKVADGQAYDVGNGIEIDKTEVNNKGATVDYVLQAQAFSDTGENISNTAIVQAATESTQEEQDERTGSPVFSRQQFEPAFSFVTNSVLDDLKQTSDPLVIGCAQDTNPKQSPLLDKIQNIPGLVRGDIFRVVNPDPDLLSNNLVGSKLIPNNSSVTKDYKITKVLLCTDGYGDVNGDGVIDQDDIIRATALVGESLQLDSTQQRIVDGHIDALEIIRADVDGDGYVTAADVDLITQFVTRDTNSFPVGTSFTHLEMQVQQSTGRFDGYHDCTDGSNNTVTFGRVRPAGDTKPPIDATTLSDSQKEYYGLTETPDMNQSDVAFNAVPFQDIPYQIQPLPWWQEYLLAFSSNARFVTAAFTSDDSDVIADCETQTTAICIDRNDVVPECDPGKNEIMIPSNLIIKQGQILSADGSHHKVDLEINHIILQLPESPLDESIIDVFRKLVADSGDGFTSAGYPAQRFSDCTTVGVDALARGQVKFGVAVQAFNPNLDGYTAEDGYVVIVDDHIGVNMDHANGLLTLTVQDLEVDPIYMTLVTKIEITVYLKKGGWNQNTLVVPPEQIQGLLS